MYMDYYVRPSGTGLPVFMGVRGQRGHGLGSMLSSFFRSAWPVIKSGLGFLGKQALKTGAEIATDVSEGKSFKDAAKQHVSRRINEFVPGLIPQSGSGIRRRRNKRKTSVSGKTKSGKKRKRDIFG